MKVMINKHIYNSKDTLIAVILSKEEKDIIKKMNDSDNTLIDYPDSMDKEEVDILIKELLSGNVFA